MAFFSSILQQTLIHITIYGYGVIWLFGLFSFFGSTEPTGSSQIQEREEDTYWTKESIIFFTDLLFAGITDAISGFSQHVVVLLFPKTTPSIAVEFFFFIAFFFGSVMIAAISSLGLLCFTTNFWALVWKCVVVFMCLMSCKSLRPWAIYKQMSMLGHKKGLQLATCKGKFKIVGQLTLKAPHLGSLGCEIKKL